MSHRSKRRFAAALLALLAPCVHAAEAVADREWNFVARLDDRPIGWHRFSLRGGDAGSAERSLTSDASFDVKLLGLTVYRYRHRVSERWRGDCLARIVARTDDNGRVTEVSGAAAGAGFALDVVPGGSAGPSGPSCLMSFAYWNDALGAQRRLLDPATGRIENVAIEPITGVPAGIRGARGGALRGLRIGGLAHPIDVWYAGSEWVGLDTVVDGGRRLSYRLE